MKRLIMKTSLFSALILGLLIIAMPVQQVQAQVEGASFDMLIASLDEAIELTDQQQEQLRSFAANRELEATSLWRFSAELHELLSDEQRSTLHHEMDGERMMEERSRRGMEGRSRMEMPQLRIPLNIMHPMLSEEQREELRSLMNSMMQEFRSTWEDYTGEEFDREELQRDMRALRDSVEHRARDLLTEEQYEALKDERGPRTQRDRSRRHTRDHDGEQHMMQGENGIMHEHHSIMQTHHSVMRHFRQLQSD